MSEFRPHWLVPEWPAPAGVRAISTLRGGGSSEPPYASLNLGDHVGDRAASVAANRAALRAAAGLAGEPAWLTQVHGTRVLDLDAGEVGGRAHDSPDYDGPADAALTRRAGPVCAILTADCLPVLLASDSGDRVGAVHAGWRGLAAGVIEAAVHALGGAPGELLAWLGPAIGPRHFEVGGEVREAFLRAAEAGGTTGAGSRAQAGGGRSAAWGHAEVEAAPVAGTAADAVARAFVPNERKRFMADLYALARVRLAALGVHRIYGGGECTHAQGDRYFSHRRDGTTGRQATLIWLAPPPRR